MAIFLVTYDVNSPNTHLRERLRQEIFKMPCAQPSESTYVVQFNGGNAETLHTHLAKFIDNNDRLFVFRLAPDWTGRGDKPDIEWLDQAYKMHLFN